MVTNLHNFKKSFIHILFQCLQSNIVYSICLKWPLKQFKKKSLEQFIACNLLLNEKEKRRVIWNHEANHHQSSENSCEDHSCTVHCSFADSKLASTVTWTSKPTASTHMIHGNNPMVLFFCHSKVWIQTQHLQFSYSTSRTASSWSYTWWIFSF